MLHPNQTSSLLSALQSNDNFKDIFEMNEVGEIWDALGNLSEKQYKFLLAMLFNYNYEKVRDVLKSKYINTKII